MSSVEAWLTTAVPASLRRNESPLLAGDPSAEPVLRELSDDPRCRVRQLAQMGLKRLGGDLVPVAALTCEVESPSANR